MLLAEHVDEQSLKGPSPCYAYKQRGTDLLTFVELKPVALDSSL